MGYRVTFEAVDVAGEVTRDNAIHLAAQIIAAEPDFYVKRCEEEESIDEQP